MWSLAVLPVSQTCLSAACHGQPSTVQHSFEAYLASGPLVGVGLQQLCDELLCIFTDFLPVALVEDNTAVLALLNQVCKVLGPEWRVTTEQCVGDDSHGPHVDRLAVALLQHNLRRCVTKRTSHGGQHLVLRVEHLGDTEVSQHKGRIRFASDIEQVLGLEIYGIVSTRSTLGLVRLYLCGRSYAGEGSRLR